MSFRKVVDEAMRGLAGEFAAVVERKLLELIAQEATPPTVPALRGRARGARDKASAKRAAPAKATSKPAAPKKKASAPKAAAATGKDVNLRDRILGVLDRETGMSRSQLLQRLGLDNRHEAKLGIALIRLRTDKLVTMEGNRRGATYKLA